MKVFLIILGLLAISIILLSVRLFFGREFISSHVDQNPYLHKKGIHCAQSQDAAARLHKVKQFNKSK